MTLRAVDLTITTATEDPIQGVVVRVLSQDGTTFYTQSTTDSSGRVGFLLDPAFNLYQVRFYKQHVSFANPMYLEVADSDTGNDFATQGELVTPPVPTDGRLCTAYGFFRNASGRPASNVRIYFISKFRPLLLEGDAVLTERACAITDDKGYCQVDLIRNGQYDVTVTGIQDITRQISVPDQANVNLPDLLFPVVSRIDFSPSIPSSMLVGDELQVTPTVKSSDGNTVNTYDVIWSSSNPDVLAVLLAGGVITLRAVSAGSADVRAVRADTSIIQIPDVGILNVPVTVTVT